VLLTNSILQFCSEILNWIMVRAFSRPFEQFDIFRLEKVNDDFCPMAWRPVVHKYFAIMHCHVSLQLLFDQFQIFFAIHGGSGIEEE